MQADKVMSEFEEQKSLITHHLSRFTFHKSIQTYQEELLK